MSRLTVKTGEKRFSVAPNLYGLFFEDINRAGDSGLYPEMLRNRSFEDSIPPERCELDEGGVNFTTPQGWSDQFNNGEGLKKWLTNIPPTPVPAWYADKAAMTFEGMERLNPQRLVSLRVDFSAGGSIRNTGYRGVPLRKGESYAFYMFAKAHGAPAKLKVEIASADGVAQDGTSFTVETGTFQRYDHVFTAKRDDFDARLVIKSPEASQVLFAFTSLMPVNTYMGHGMRKDLMALLAASNFKFLRFPGGCIVEGFTYETAMRFQNTVGAPWERPSHQLMWHYRTTNGLGFHEFLQICEDLGLEPMYVLNCGLTCQGREPEFFEGKELEAMLRETFDAVEYAIGDASTPMGRKRAAAGHPEPFKLTYVEIGNENGGPEYFSRYATFYDALKAKYPQIQYISNTHTEREGLPTEIADEHYYNTPEFFAENTHKFDAYDRGGPEIFVGEYAVTAGVKTATLRCALAESMFLLGIENNQDIVRLTAYAPLFQNVGYTGWYPNLIAFDNHRSYGIPTYHALSMLAGNRGKDVVASTVESDKLYRNTPGLPGILAPKGGIRFRNARIDGTPASVSHQIQGSFLLTDNEYIAVQPASQARKHYLYPGTEATDGVVFAVLGEKPQVAYTFEAEIKSKDGNPITLASWCHRPFSVFRIDETEAPDKLDLSSTRRFEWTVAGSVSSVSEVYYGQRLPMGKDAPVSIDMGQYNTYKIIARPDGLDCYINGTLAQQVSTAHHSAVAASAVTEDESIIIKIVNIKCDIEAVKIELDCPVQPDYTVRLLTADDPDATNSLENPAAVSPVSKTMTGAAQRFTYNAPAYSLSILTLRKESRQSV